MRRVHRAHVFRDFFKVGIFESGNHDQRLYEDDWGERYQGLLTKTADGRRRKGAIIMAFIVLQWPNHGR